MVEKDLYAVSGGRDERYPRYWHVDPEFAKRYLLQQQRWRDTFRIQRKSEETRGMDDKTLRFLRLLREQVRGREPLEGDRRNIYTWGEAQGLGMEYDEYVARLEELARAGYLYPHPNPTFEAQGVYTITDGGIAAADEE